MLACKPSVSYNYYFSDTPIVKNSTISKINVIHCNKQRHSENIFQTKKQVYWKSIITLLVCYK